MAVINISDETKERFRKRKLEHAAKSGEDFSEDKFMVVLLDKFEEKKK